MRNLLAGFILIITLPLVGSAQAAGESQRPDMAPSPTSETMPSAPNPQTPAPAVDTQSEAYTTCLRATQRFDQQEQAKGNRKVEITSLTASCKEELKPVEYWKCMEKEADQNVDFNTAHGHCARQNNLK